MSVSPDGARLAVGSHDNKVYIYSCADWSLLGTLTGHSSYIIAIDWCSHNKYIRTNDGAYELLFWEVDAFRQEPNGKSLLTPVEWATDTVKLGWHVQGVYPKGTDGTHINSVNRNEDGSLLVTGDDWCLMRIFNNPCLVGHRPRSYRGHSEFVTNAVFNGGKIYTVGGYDQTLMQWKKK